MTNSRWKRVYKDRAGTAAATNTDTFLLQTYKAVLGGGKFALVKDCSVPIFISGKHWGCQRLTYTL